MARIVEHLSAEELGARYHAAQSVTEARHTQAIWLLAQGRTTLEVAAVLAFTPRWVEELAARYNVFGPDALGDRRRRNGRAASVLTPALLAALTEHLKAPPEDGGRWTGPKVAVWMASQLGVERVAPVARLGGATAGPLVHPGPAPRHPRSATPEQRTEFKGGSTRWSRVPGQRSLASRSRSGPRTSIASA